MPLSGTQASVLSVRGGALTLCRPRFQHTLYFSYSGHSGRVVTASAWRVVRPQGSHHKAQGWATACFPVLTTLGSRDATHVSAEVHWQGVSYLQIRGLQFYLQRANVAAGLHSSQIGGTLDNWLESKITDYTNGNRCNSCLVGMKACSHSGPLWTRLKTPVLEDDVVESFSHINCTLS